MPKEHSFVSTSSFPPPSHPPFAANSLPYSQMPLLVNKLIFSLIPARAPFFIRPLLWMVFGQLDKQMLMPQIGKNKVMVGFFYFLALHEHTFWFVWTAFVFTMRLLWLYLGASLYWQVVLTILPITRLRPTSKIPLLQVGLQVEIIRLPLITWWASRWRHSPVKEEMMLARRLWSGFRKFMRGAFGFGIRFGFLRSKGMTYLILL